jgi:hypothetical protein
MVRTHTRQAAGSEEALESLVPRAADLEMAHSRCAQFWRGPVVETPPPAASGPAFLESGALQPPPRQNPSTP